MKRRILGIVLLSLLSPLSLAVAWGQMGISDGQGNRYQLEPQTISRLSDGQVRFWVQKHMESSNSPIKMAREERTVNCQQKTIAVNQYIYYGWDGSQVGSMVYPRPPFQNAGANPAYETIINTICKTG